MSGRDESVRAHAPEGLLGSPRPAPVRFLTGALAALAGFAATAGLLRAAVPDPLERDADVATVERAWELAAPETDLLLLGSSRVYAQVLPDVVEGRLRERGHPLRTFVGAIQGSFALETGVRLRRFLAVPAPRLRVVVLELQPFLPEIPPGMQYTQRAIDWHDTRATRTALAACLGSPEPWSTRLADASVHLGHWAARTTGTGLVGAALQRARQASTGEDERIAGESARARMLTVVRARGGDGVQPQRRHPDFRREDFDEQVRQLREGVAADRRPGFVRPELLQGQVDAIRSTGALPVLFVPAVPDPFAEAPGAASGAGDVPLLALNTPASRPELFDWAERIDRFHFLGDGRRKLSLAFADALADLLDARGAASGGSPGVRKDPETPR